MTGSQFAPCAIDPCRPSNHRACSTKASIRQTLLVIVTHRSFWYCGDTSVVLWPDNIRHGSGNVSAFKLASTLTRIRTSKGHLLRPLDLISDLYKHSLAFKVRAAARSCMKPCCHRAAGTMGPFQIPFAKMIQATTRGGTWTDRERKKRKKLQGRFWQCLRAARLGLYRTPSPVCLGAVLFWGMIYGTLNIAATVCGLRTRARGPFHVVQRSLRKLILLSPGDPKRRTTC